VESRAVVEMPCPRVELSEMFEDFVKVYPGDGDGVRLLVDEDAAWRWKVGMMEEVICCLNQVG
jgi:hypothetical protein